MFNNNYKKNLIYVIRGPLCPKSVLRIYDLSHSTGTTIVGVLLLLWIYSCDEQLGPCAQPQRTHSRALCVYVHLPLRDDDFARRILSSPGGASHLAHADAEHSGEDQ